MRVLRMADGRVKVLVQGLSRARIDSFVEQESATWARIGAIEDAAAADWCVEAEALVRAVRARVEELLPLKNLPPEVLSVTVNVNEPGQLADLVASNLKLRVAEAQEVLEIADPIQRLRKVDALLRRELDVTTVQAEIQSQAHDEMTRSQREHFLREQLRAIQSELGEGDGRLDEADEYRAKLEEAGLPDEAMAEATRQLRRLERMHPDGPEAHVVRTYLDWMCELPWSNTSGTSSSSPPRRRSSTRTTRTSRESRTGSSNTSACASCAAIRAGRSCASSARPASARPRSAARSRARWAASSCASRSAACATRPRSAATAAPTSARCPGGSCRA
jgi:ATP-dependent Lon protease